jgi:regulator of nucleoside diphosphate kinase
MVQAHRPNHGIVAATLMSTPGYARRRMATDLLIITDVDLARLRRLPLDEGLQRELERAIVVSSEAVPRDVVTMNSRVLYVDETTGERRWVTIVYPETADAGDGRVSVLAPVGAALLGLSVGQAIEWEFPDGGTRRLRVEDVTYEPGSCERREASSVSPGSR